MENTFLVEEKAKDILRGLIEKKAYVEMLVGRNGEFDRQMAACVRQVKREVREDNSALVLVLPYVTAEYRENVDSFEKYYDEIEICEQAAGKHFKLAIQTRNRWMVDRSDLVICYVTHLSGGAYQTVSYAKRQKKNVINLANI